MAKKVSEQFSPMMQQYRAIKNRHSDCVIFYRVGDFYEMFFEDAKIGSKELELALTGKDCGTDKRAPMCGVPYHSCEAYIGRLVAKGYKVAICEQLEDPKNAKGLVNRDVVRIITPGTVTEDSLLDDSKNNYCAAIYIKNSSMAVAFADISTGDLWATSIDKNDRGKLTNELGRFCPKEAVLSFDQQDEREVVTFLKSRINCYVSSSPERFDEDVCRQRLETQYGENYIDESCIENFDGAIPACGALLTYLSENRCGELPNMHRIALYLQGEFLDIDVSSRRNLEICENMRTNSKNGSLLWAVGKTKTAMGARMLRRWLEQPLCDLSAIKKRQNAVSAFCLSSFLRDDMAKVLGDAYDLERLLGKVAYNSANCRDLIAIRDTLSVLPQLKALMEESDSKYLHELDETFDDMAELREILELAVAPDPPLSVKEGGIIKKGYDEQVDRLNDILAGGKQTILEMEAFEREKTGIRNLKIAYNKVFGYYIEVTRSYLDLVPSDYVRKQTLTGCERYINDRLKEYEQTVFGAQEKVAALEYEIFCKLRELVASEIHRLQQAATAIATVDVLRGFAEVACENSYCCPEVDFSGIIEIKDGRHPVVENCLEDSVFVANDALLDCGENRCAIITGPNMAGKSTYMRQIALCVILAQAGSFVPASFARIGIVDKLFTRVGASDDLATGQSTFMLEMSELSYILKNATPRSLLVFDEIGRGTSTYDGMSIARAVLEYVVDKDKLGAKTLFATHYHELTELEDEFEGIKNYSTAVKKRGDDITFLRRIVRGGADKSYGIEVALLAGVPQNVIDRAKEILGDLSAAPSAQLQKGQPERAAQRRRDYGDENCEQIIDQLKKVDLNTLTPLECMHILNELKKQAEKA